MNSKELMSHKEMMDSIEAMGYYVLPSANPADEKDMGWQAFDSETEMLLGGWTKRLSKVYEYLCNRDERDDDQRFD